jgi:lipid-A-disaccharide synthase
LGHGKQSASRGARVAQRGEEDLVKQPRILVSAGEASGDLYAAGVVNAVRERMGAAEFFGCTGSRLREAGVEQVVDAASLSVVGLVEVVHHIPRIYGEYRRLIRAIAERKPDLAILTDSPSFHMRVARRLRRMGVPVVYLVAPQVWAWKQWRVRQIRRDITKLLCIFPFEERWFRDRGVDAEYIGHPLARLIRPATSKEQFLETHSLDPARRVIVLLPGSRMGEAKRHLEPLADAVRILQREQPASFILASPPGRPASFWEPISTAPIKIIEGQTWDAIAHADLALAASGTVTVETALLGVPMVTFYRVTPLSWWLGKFLVNVPFYSMVNLIADRRIVPELMQESMTGEALAAEAGFLLNRSETRSDMKRGLAEVAAKLSGEVNPFERAACVVQSTLNKTR